jgi:hypothetical protein
MYTVACRAPDGNNPGKQNERFREDFHEESLTDFPTNVSFGKKKGCAQRKGVRTAAAKWVKLRATALEQKI